jgi:hypothetical protein
MTGKIFGWTHEPIGGPRYQVGLCREQHIGDPPDPPMAVTTRASLFAMSAPRKGGVPMVHQYEDNDAGHRELANLIRGEIVLAVVKGHQVEFEHASVVALLGAEISVRLTTPLDR